MHLSNFKIIKSTVYTPNTNNKIKQNKKRKIRKESLVTSLAILIVFITKQRREKPTVLSTQI